MTIRLQSLNVMGNTALTTNELVQKMYRVDYERSEYQITINCIIDSLIHT